jgi:hypothetical protein
MSAATNTPENLNFQSPLNFKLHIQRAPHINFFVQKVNFPGILGIHAIQANPFVVINQGYDHLNFENLRVTFKVDEDFKNVFEMINWINGIGFPQNYEQYADLKKGQQILGQGVKSNISLQILNSKHNFGLEVIFDDAFPVEFSGWEFDSTETDVNYITTTVTFKYNFYTFNLLKPQNSA